MFLVDIEGASVLYTGDYSLENERHILKVNKLIYYKRQKFQKIDK
jgi:hypothetical protein